MNKEFNEMKPEKIENNLTNKEIITQQLFSLYSSLSLNIDKLKIYIVPFIESVVANKPLPQQLLVKENVDIMFEFNKDIANLINSVIEKQNKLFQESETDKNVNEKTES